ncbi:MAG: NAD(+)/NADH kinase [Desulfuromusa sp.]|jgi:predicted polyphosphate/ATP-dependent NAD kinase|nr:NAD(+)/NADH kinase [Desulfuromusa sp.]
MDSSITDNATVGIIANPASGQDIRRLISAASGLSIAEKTNIVRRLCLGLALLGVNRVSMIPDQSGIAGSLLRSKDQGTAALGEGWPEIELLEMPVEEKAIDTLRAVELMVRSGVQLIIVLGGDGTHRLVASACGEIPIIALSTGTNNTFPGFQEATIVGLAAGLVARGAVPLHEATRRNKLLRVEMNQLRSDVALVDLCLTDELWIGSRAVWKPEKVKEVFVAFAEADAIGWSSVAGLVNPVSRESDQGLHLTLCPPGKGQLTIYAPIAPGLIVPVGIEKIQILKPLERVTLDARKGVIALDGEREFTFCQTDKVEIWLDQNGPLTVDVPKVLQIAAERGVLNYPSVYIQ